MKVKLVPNIKVYQYQAFADLICMNHVDYLNWYHNNYIQIYGYLNEDEKDLTNKWEIDYFSASIYGYIPLLTWTNYSEELSQRGVKSIIKVMKENTDENCAWYMLIDHYYLEQEESYKQTHFIHDVLITEDKGDYVNYIHSNYGEYFQHAASNTSITDAFTANACLYKITVNEAVSYQFNLGNFIEMIKDYLYSRDSRINQNLYLDHSLFHSEIFYHNRLENAQYFGLDVYQLMQQYSLDCIKAGSQIDYRKAYLLFEHKEKMIKSIQFCMEQGYVKSDIALKMIQDYENIKRELQLYLMLVLKYNLNYRKDVLIKKISTFTQIVQEEKRILNQLVSCLERVDFFNL